MPACTPSSPPSGEVLLAEAVTHSSAQTFAHHTPRIASQGLRHPSIHASCETPRGFVRRTTTPTNLGGRSGVWGTSVPGPGTAPQRSLHRCQAAQEAGGWSPESDDPVALASQLESLQDLLAEAVQSEDYSFAAQLRDRLRVLEEDTSASVLVANKRFYRAFEAGDVKAMRQCWVQGEHVTCIHPSSSAIVGYDLVMASWEMVLAGMRNCSIRLEDVRVHVAGSLAYVTCVELVGAPGSSGRLVATNVFERAAAGGGGGGGGGGEWRIVLHHASSSMMRRA